MPFFLLPARLMGRRLASLAHEQMVQNADLGTRMTERFNVAGALLVKLFGRPAVEDERVCRARRPACATSACGSPSTARSSSSR